MNFNSTDEEEPKFLTENNEDYMETCDNEVNDMLPQFQRLNIDDEVIEIRSGNMIKRSLSLETFPTLINDNEVTSMSDSNARYSPTFISDLSDGIWINEVTKAKIDKEKSSSETSETTQAIPPNIPVGSQPQVVVQNTLADVSIPKHPINEKDEHKLDETEETKETGMENILGEGPLNLCLVQRLDHAYAVEPSSSVFKSETELLSLMAAPQTEETKETGMENVLGGGPLNLCLVQRLDRTYAVEPSSSVSESETELLSLMAAPQNTKLYRETDEVTDTSNIIFPEKCDSQGNALGQYDTIVEFNYPNTSYSADVSSDDQSCINSGVINYSSPEVAVFVPETSQMNPIRQRRFGTIQLPTGITTERESSKANSISGEDSQKLSVIGNASPINTTRRYKKGKKTLSPRFQIPQDAKNDKEKRPSPCKRKKMSVDNLCETTGKFRKRSTSENKSETGGKTRLANRTRSLSSGSKVNSSSVSISPILQMSRKRTSSEFRNVGRVKSRRSSSSSDDAQNK